MEPGAGKYGIWHMILASFAGMFGAIVIGVPIGLLTAVFLAELAPRRLANLCVRPLSCWPVFRRSSTAFSV